MNQIQALLQETDVLMTNGDAIAYSEPSPTRDVLVQIIKIAASC